jgi:aspartate carbamoyltransferase regulatory subunit
MIVESLKDGIVIDHIAEGRGYRIFSQLGLDKLGVVVVLLRNVPSEKMERKDLIKIETENDIDLDVLGLIDPGATVNYIKGGLNVRKIKIEPPEEVEGILTCKNPKCITNIERIPSVAFRLLDSRRMLYRCTYCDATASL